MSIVSIALAASLAAAPSLPANPKLAALGFKFLNIEEKAADYFSEFFAQQLQEAGLAVTTEGSMTALLGFERQKQLLGCSTESAGCVAELAGALGVDALVLGSLGKFGSEYAVTVKIISAKDSSTVLAESGRVDGDRALLDWLTAVARKMSLTIGKAPPRDSPKLAALPPNAAPAKGRGPGAAVWLYGGGGVALLAGSGVTFLLAGNQYNNLNSQLTYRSIDDVKGVRFWGELYQWSSAGLLLAGVVSVGAAGYSWWRDASGPSIAIVPSPGGAAVVFGGELP